MDSGLKGDRIIAAPDSPISGTPDTSSRFAKRSAANQAQSARAQSARAMTPADILNHPQIHTLIRQQALGFVQRFSVEPGIARIFATHQRWLLSHIGLMQYFETGQIMPARFFDQVDANAVASRNTADAFLKEMETYHIVEALPSSDRRSRPLAPTAVSLTAITSWLMMHLHTLDCFDGGTRLQRLTTSPELMRDVHPRLAKVFLITPELREQPASFKPFTWLNNGNIIIDWMVANSEEAPKDSAQIPTAIVSIQEMAEVFHLSRTHLTRKLLEAENMHIIGWQGRRGRSVLWISNTMRADYARAQSVKLSIIDQACADCGVI